MDASGMAISAATLSISIVFELAVWVSRALRGDRGTQRRSPWRAADAKNPFQHGHRVGGKTGDRAERVNN